MKSKPLASIINIPNNDPSDPTNQPNDPCQTENPRRAIHVIFAGRDSKQRYLEHYLQPFKLARKDVIRITTNRCYPRHYQTAEVSVDSFEQLVAYLRSLLSSKMDMLPSVVIIDDLSQYFWCFKSTGQLLKYVQIAELASQLHGRFNCRMVMFSWHNLFERGFKFQGLISPEGDLEAVTYLPEEYYKYMDQILYVGDEVYEYSDGWKVKNA